jgi:RNA polymerase sigma-70 factor (ECF subfamily)
MMTEMIQIEISVEALKADDRAEFARLVDVASSPIYRLGLKMLGNPQDAEDVLQNTFLKAMQSLKHFEGRSSPLTWLYRIAVNEALMLIRRQRPQVEIAEEPQEDADNLPAPMQLTDWCCLPESDFLTAESRRALDAAILTLPEKLRVVFLLRDIEGLSIYETSEALNLSETAVKTRLLRARLYLREQLSVYFSDRVTQESVK